MPSFLDRLRRGEPRTVAGYPAVFHDATPAPDLSAVRGVHVRPVTLTFPQGNVRTVAGNTLASAPLRFTVPGRYRVHQVDLDLEESVTAEVFLDEEQFLYSAGGEFGERRYPEGLRPECHERVRCDFTNITEDTRKGRVTLVVEAAA